jgi:DNA-binding MarR family transcriptional regulator
MRAALLHFLRRRFRAPSLPYHCHMIKRKTSPGGSAAASGEPAGSELGEPAVRVLRQFRLVFNAVKTHFQQVEKKAGVGGAQLWALSVVQSSKGIGVNDLARAMDVHQSTASNLVRTLVERELIGTERIGADRRTVQLRILPAGGRVLRRAPGPFTGVLPQALASLDAATLARLDKDLGKLITALDADASGANVPLGQT